MQEWKQSTIWLWPWTYNPICFGWLAGYCFREEKGACSVAWWLMKVLRLAGWAWYLILTGWTCIAVA